MIFKKLILITIFFILSYSHTQAQGNSNYNWQAGEELVYEVAWSFVDLGVITLKNLGKTKLKGKTVNHIQVIIESNPLLFWLDHESIYNSYIPDDLKTMRYESDENIDGESYKGQYDFNYEKQKIELTLFDKENPKIIKKKVIPLKPKMVDGISLIQYARVNSMEMKKDTATTFIEDKFGDVIFDFSLKKQVTKVEAIPEGINTIYFDGVIFMKGIAGLTGPFKTWYSDDSSRVPILAFMEVFIGEVRIELHAWKKWSPQKLITEIKN